MITILDNKSLPHSIDAEINILGCILIDNCLIEKARQAFGSNKVFYSKKNQTVYEAMIVLYGKSLPIDLVNLRYHLKEIGHLSLVDEGYLLSLEEAVPHARSFNYYVDEVLKLFKNRKKVELSARVIEGTYKGIDVDTSELIPLLENHKTNSIGIVLPSDIENEVRELHKSGGLKRGVSTGWGAVDSCYTILPGLLTILTGIPSHGKSTWLTNLLINLAMRHGWRFALFSPENMPLKRYIAQIISVYVGKVFNYITEDELEYSLGWIRNHFVFLQPSDNELTIEHLISKARFCIENYGINGLVIDPWNEVDHCRPDRLTETEHVSECLSKIKRLAQTHQIHVWLVAHPTKLQKQKDGTYGVPTAYDISGSAHFRNKADVCLCVWRDLLADDGITEIHVQKVRFREIGKIGMVQLKYNTNIGKYE